MESSYRNNVTACLITWKRQQNIPKIVESLLRHPFIDEIIIQDNSKGKNLINYGRYISAAKAKNDIIYTQDDDCIVENLGDVYETFIKDPTRIAHSGLDYYERDIPNNIYGETQMSLAGWGSFFKKDWIKVLQSYINKYGQDYCFYRETDRIFSILLGKRSNFILGRIEEFPDAHNEHALSEQEDHIRYKNMSIKRALELYESISYHPNR